MADKRIGELPSAAGVYGDSLFVMEQQSTAMSVRGELISNFAKQEVSEYVEPAKQAAEDAKQAAKDAAESLGDLNNQVELAEGYANNAKSSATEAKKSEQTANTYKTAAETAKNEAAESEANAKKYADSASESLSESNAAKTAAEQSADRAKESETAAAESLAGTLASQTAAEEAKDTAVQKAVEAKTSADKAQQYSGNPAIVGENNHWMIWDADAGEYQDSGKRAVLDYDITYPSVEAMEDDAENQSTNTVAIISSDVNVEDNARLYIKRQDGTWGYLTDLSGFTGNGIQSWEKTSGDGSPGTFDTYTVTWTDGRSIEYQVWNGATGPTGPQGHDFAIADTYETLAALEEAHPDPKPGDVYAVGTEDPYDIYIYGETSGWTNHGHLQGPKGEKGDKGEQGFIPEISERETWVIGGEDTGKPTRGKDAVDTWESKTTTFNPGGSITEVVSKTRTETVFNSDGSITDTMYVDDALYRTKNTYFDGDVIREVVT